MNHAKITPNKDTNYKIPYSNSTESKRGFILITQTIGNHRKSDKKANQIEIDNKAYGGKYENTP